MCSILGIFDIKDDPKPLRQLALKLSKRQRHRGPDWSGVFSSDQVILAHERLAIVDVEHGAQPLFSLDRSLVLAVNGEIYNHRPLEQGLDRPYDFQTKSDCEVILALYDQKRNRYFIARDPIGVMPLYTGYDEHGHFYVASEMKALIDTCRTIREFPPGHFLDSETGKV
ncbi:MAG: asparagine synthase B, partial [Thermoanaerobaculia bacterium]